MQHSRLFDLVAGNQVRRHDFESLLAVLRKYGNQRKELRRLNNVIKQMRHDLDAAHQRNIQLVNQLITISRQEAA